MQFCEQRLSDRHHFFLVAQSSADRPTPPPPQTPLAKNTSVAAVAAAAAATTIANNNNNNTGQLGKKEKRLSTTRYNVTKNRELLPLPRLLGEWTWTIFAEYLHVFVRAKSTQCCWLSVCACLCSNGCDSTRCLERQCVCVYLFECLLCSKLKPPAATQPNTTY